MSIKKFTQTDIRNSITHRVLFYLQERMSSKNPIWRDCTLRFLYELFILMESNPSIVLDIKKDDGMHIYNGSEKIVYLHFRQRHFLAHCNEDYLLSKVGRSLFSKTHEGSWPIMWKIDNVEEVETLLDYLRSLPSYTPSDQEKASRTIPVWVQQFVIERDSGICQSCGSNENLCFDHILPFSKGGASDHPNNIQLLCSKCNLEKSANFWPVKILG